MCGFSPLTMWISVNPASRCCSTASRDELGGRRRVGVLLLLRRREGTELAFHPADVRLAEVEVLDERHLVRAAAKPAREIGQLADLEQVVRLEEREPVLEVEPLTRLELLADRIEGGGAVEECQAVRSVGATVPIGCGRRQRLRGPRARRDALVGEARPRPSSVVEGHLPRALEGARRSDAHEDAVERPAGDRGANDVVLPRREQERQRRRPVAEVGAGILPGLDRVTGAVEDVVDDLERDAEQPPVVAAAAAEHARGLEQLPGLQRTPLEVPVDGRVGVVALPPLQRLPARERQRGVGEHGDASHVDRRPRAPRRRARRGSRPPPAPRRRRGPSRPPPCRDGPSRRRSGRRGRASPCERARRRHLPRPTGAAPAGAERKVSIGRSRFPPAVSASAPTIGDEPGMAGDRPLEQILDLGEVARPDRERHAPPRASQLIAPSPCAARRSCRRRGGSPLRAKPARRSADELLGAREAANARREVRVGLAARERRGRGAARSGRTRARRTASAVLAAG